MSDQTNIQPQDENRLIAERREKLAAWRASGCAFPNDFSRENTPGKLAGTITYLCDTLASALALDALYQSAATITLTSDAGAPLNGLQHVAVGDLRYNAERGLPGRPSKWTITVEIREL